MSFLGFDLSAEPSQYQLLQARFQLNATARAGLGLFELGLCACDAAGHGRLASSSRLRSTIACM
jgi:hypothetical protein